MVTICHGVNVNRNIITSPTKAIFTSLANFKTTLVYDGYYSAVEPTTQKLTGLIVVRCLSLGVSHGRHALITQTEL